MGAIFKRDFSSYFTSTLGYIVIALYMLLSGFFFWLICFYSQYNSLVEVINNMLYVVFFLVPLITMRSFAEEKRQRTDQALLTAPVGLWEIVFGKYLSALALYTICNMAYFLYALVLLISIPDVTIQWGQLLSGWLGIMLLGAALLAINLFYSSLTEYQIIAAVIGMGTGLVLMLYDSIVGAINSFINTLFSTSHQLVVLDKLSLTNHYMNLVKGVINPADVIFYLSWVMLFLFLTVRILDKKRWA
ncbi:MAG: ABC transporter [Ruminococcaceae bacterium]|nr:ABC transporter [Oscillospiraceae bacterium]